MAVLVICWRKYLFGGLELGAESWGKYVGSPIKSESSGGGQPVVHPKALMTLSWDTRVLRRSGRGGND